MTVWVIEFSKNYPQKPIYQIFIVFESNFMQDSGINIHVMPVHNSAPTGLLGFLVRRLADI